MKPEYLVLLGIAALIWFAPYILRRIGNVLKSFYGNFSHRGHDVPVG